MKVYLDTNIFYNAYCPVESNDIADWILDQLNPKIQGVTSEWTLLEMFRALKKQVNLNKIEEKEAKLTLDFFLSEIGEMTETEKIVILPITRSMIIGSRRHVFDYNLYAADALHATVAVLSQVTYFITFDGDFSMKLGDIPILNPNDSEFRNFFVT